MSTSSGIELPSDGPCAFCAYLNEKRPYTILARNEVVAILVTREQRGVSHLLVIPVRHAPTILDIDEVESAALMRGVRVAARLIDTADKPSGISVWQNNGTSASQAISHLHFHVAGTLPGGGTEWGEVDELSVAETDAIAQRLRRSAPRSLDLK